ncbi:hypothetical protein PENSPDRAFT_691048 [Peniophora sp. CONT]|nr:hypothetical protein PENSPDRAFT_691048 [Peniophora sp. CONT]
MSSRRKSSVPRSKKGESVASRSQKGERVVSDSPYVQQNIFADASVTKLAADLRARRPALRCLSSLLPKMPFYASAIYKSESLSEWLQETMGSVSDGADFVFEFAKYLDWWERTGVYQDRVEGKPDSRRKNKEARLLVRRFGLEKTKITPAPDQFQSIQGKTSLTWTETHQWLILLRFFDVLVHLRGIVDEDFERVPPSPALLLSLTRGLGQSWLSMRVDWQAALKDCAAALTAAGRLEMVSQPPPAPRQQIEGGTGSDSAAEQTRGSPEHSTPASAFSSAAAPSADQPRGSLEQSSPDHGMDNNSFAANGTSSTPEASPTSSTRLSFMSAASGDSETMNVLFSKFDKMALTAAFERIIPSIKKIDSQSQYLAMHLATDWMAPRYIYQPFMLMLMYSPLFVLARTRLYSAPLHSMASAFEIFKAMGNVGKPVSLQVLEKSIWALVLQVAHGASVSDVLPVYMAVWISDIDSDQVTACKSWLDDFGLKAAAAKEGPVQDWDDEDEIQLLREYTSQRDEHREWKTEINDNGKRSLSSPGLQPAGKRKARARNGASKGGDQARPSAGPSATHARSVSLSSIASTQRASQEPAKNKARSRQGAEDNGDQEDEDDEDEDKNDEDNEEDEDDAEEEGEDQDQEQVAGGVKNKTKKRVAEQDEEDEDEDEEDEEEDEEGEDEDVVDDGEGADDDDENITAPKAPGDASIYDEMFSDRLTPLLDDNDAQGASTGVAVAEQGAQPMDVDGDDATRAADSQPSFIPPASSSRSRDFSQKDASPGDERGGNQQESSVPAGNAATPRSVPAYVPVPVTVPMWSSAGLQSVTWAPLRSRTFDMFTLLSEKISTTYAPGSQSSAIRVFTPSEFSALDTRAALDVFSKHHVLVRGGDVDLFWSWGLAALSALRPVHGTTVQVQDPIASYAGPGFATITVPLHELVKVGQKDSGKVWNCLDIPLGERRLSLLPHVSDPRTFNIFPLLYNVAVQDLQSMGTENADDIRKKMHWALAGVAGADTLQHIDTGGFATVVHVLSGTKMWAIGSRVDGTAFANHSHALGKSAQESDWHSLRDQSIRWESMLLEAGDVLFMRPGPHMVHTISSSVCYGEYFLTPSTLVDHITSYVLSRMADLVATNDRIDNGSLYLAIPSWWWWGDIAAGEDDYDPSARASRPSLADDPRAYVAVLGFHVFQTMLAITSFEKIPVGRVRIEHAGERVSREPAERLHEWICHQGIVARKGEDVDINMDDKERIQRLRDIILDFGIGIYAMAAEHSRTEPTFDLAFVRNRLGNDARAAYNVPMTKWLNKADLDPRLLIPDLQFYRASKPGLLFAFHT